jgi:hypothetical protein
MPWFGGAVATCSGTNCVVDTRSGHVDATFDIAPGDSVLVSGHVRVLDRAFYRSAISARAWGPIELDEANEIDNFAQGTIAQSLFFDGFD